MAPATRATGGAPGPREDSRNPPPAHKATGGGSAWAAAREGAPVGRARGLAAGGRGAVGYRTGKWYAIRYRSAGTTMSAASTGRPDA